MEEAVQFLSWVLSRSIDDNTLNVEFNVFQSP